MDILIWRSENADFVAGTAYFTREHPERGRGSNEFELGPRLGGTEQHSCKRQQANPATAHDEDSETMCRMRTKIERVLQVDAIKIQLAVFSCDVGKTPLQSKPGEFGGIPTQG